MFERFMNNFKSNTLKKYYFNKMLHDMVRSIYCKNHVVPCIIFINRIIKIYA